MMQKHFDVTKDGETILRIVLWNALILVVICSLQPEVVNYLVLYFVLRRYIEQIAEKYETTVQRLPMRWLRGNMNVTIEEDLACLNP